MAVGSKDLAPESLRGFDDERLLEELRKAKEALTRAVHKLPMKCRIVRREGGES